MCDYFSRISLIQTPLIDFLVCLSKLSFKALIRCGLSQESNQKQENTFDSDSEIKPQTHNPLIENFIHCFGFENTSFYEKFQCAFMYGPLDSIGCKYENINIQLDLWNLD